VGRHTQVSQIARGCIVQALPHKHRRLVDDSLAHWQPMQANKNGRDVVVVMSPGDQAGCSVSRYQVSAVLRYRTILKRYSHANVLYSPHRAAVDKSSASDSSDPVHISSEVKSRGEVV